jgi:hypothetical protein
VSGWNSQTASRWNVDLRFGAALKQFASTVDIVDEAIVDAFDGLMREYVVDRLKFSFYEILREEWLGSERDRERGLRTFHVFGGRWFSTSAVDQGKTNHTAYCYHVDRPLWITAANGDILRNAEPDGYVDSWSGESIPLPDLPAYKSGNDYAIKTSILQPLRDRDGPFGVLNLESTACLEVNEFAREELALVADAVASILFRFLAYRLSREGTADAIKQLPAFVAAERWPVTQRPKIFVAFAGDADEEVVDAIREVTEHVTGYEAAVWTDEKGDGTGVLRQDMLRDLCEARAAVCYLSQPQSQGGKYLDNPNVLFESGIAEGLRCVWKDFIVVPIRENEDRCEAGLPVDLQSLHALVVSRDSSGSLIKEDFQDRLRRRLNWH